MYYHWCPEILEKHEIRKKCGHSEIRGYRGLPRDIWENRTVDNFEGTLKVGTDIKFIRGTQNSRKSMHYGKNWTIVYPDRAGHVEKKKCTEDSQKDMRSGKNKKLEKFRGTRKSPKKS